MDHVVADGRQQTVHGLLDVERRVLCMGARHDAPFGPSDHG